MALGDGVRRNIATVSEEERRRFMYAIRELDGSRFYSDGVSYWDKQEDVHKDAHSAGQDVHVGPAFLPWHRVICNQLEGLLRQVDSALSLHYWDWTTDPRHTPDGHGGFVNLFSTRFMGSATGDAGFPLADFESTEGGDHTHIWRQLIAGAPVIASDASIIAASNGLPQSGQYDAMDQALKVAHGYAHSQYINGSIGQPHFSFHDPFVFLLHSNVDRIFAMWQRVSGQDWRLNPNLVYGSEGASASINSHLEPWSGGTGLVPWAPPENQQHVLTSKSPSVVAPPLYDFMVSQQDNWRWCHKCQGLFFAGNPGSHCPSGGGHENVGSGNYRLIQNNSLAAGQDNWRWCHKCQGLFFAGNPGSHCPSGGGHENVGSGDYRLPMNVAARPEQWGWRWCHKCQGMYFADNGTAGVCPAGGGHDHTGSGAYFAVQGRPAFGQHNWRWCHKCQGMYYAGNPGSHCPTGGAHENVGSGDYAVPSAPASYGQHNWRWCHKCQGMYYAGNPGSHCPTGGAHENVGSGDYSFRFDAQPAADQNGWRWCHKCQGLFFAFNATLGTCPAGAAHATAGSGDYTIFQR